MTHAIVTCDPYEPWCLGADGGGRVVVADLAGVPNYDASPITPCDGDDGNDVNDDSVAPDSCEPLAAIRMQLEGDDGNDGNDDSDDIPHTTVAFEPAAPPALPWQQPHAPTPPRRQSQVTPPWRVATPPWRQSQIRVDPHVARQSQVAVDAHVRSQSQFAVDPHIAGQLAVDPHIVAVDSHMRRSMSSDSAHDDSESSVARSDGGTLTHGGDEWWRNDWTPWWRAQERRSHDWFTSTIWPADGTRRQARGRMSSERFLERFRGGDINK
jgi:hypothetical protein